MIARRLTRALPLLVAVIGALGVSGPALAEPDAALAVSDVRAAPGEATFLLSARGLPPDASLARAKLRVRVHGKPLRSSTAPVPGPAGGEATRGVVVVFDTSGSMAGEPLKAARSAVAEYATGLSDNVEVGLVTTGERARTVIAPTADHQAFARAVSRLSAKGDTALYDGVSQAADLLTADGSDPYAERQILVLSDGDDTASRTSVAELTRKLTQGGLALDVVAFGARSGGSALRGLTEGSGGRLVTATDSTALTAALRSMTAESVQRVKVRVEAPAGLAGRSERLDIEVIAGGRRLVATAPVDFDRNPRPLTAERVSGGAGWLLPGIAAMMAAGLFLILVSVLRPGFLRHREGRRLSEIEQHRPGRPLPVRSGADPSVSPIASMMLGWTDRVVRSRGSGERIALQLERAGLTLRPNEWLLLRICVAMSAAAVFLLLLPWWAAVVLGGPAGWLATRLYLTMAGARRGRRFAEQLPDALQLVVGALRSGFSLSQSLDVLVREGGEPVASEFGRALAKTRLGIELETALEEAAARTGSQDLEWLVMAIRIQRDIGGNLAEVMQTAVDTMRERSRLRRHVRALSAEGRLSAWILTGMPIVLAGWIGLTRGEYLRPLYTEPMGIAMLVAAVAMVAVGAFWMSRLVKVEV